ncbi:MAG: ribosomal-processing cysteine protease Prp [Ruminococcaceae bacterium]|nr:ribosomal-processing cysteine protease Prp [Oscillospiraceae bacterium]
MIRINFYSDGELLTGFECKGHSMSAEHGHDIVCAAVSSACLMAANTVTEVMGLDADAAATDGYMRLEIHGSPKSAQDLLGGLRLHLTELANEYPDNIKVEV